ncbi:MAG TPA: (d)CMP kinase [Terriglobia bacterium]|nr:(d)CMP kinase [Terriglobia bacterium]
MHTPLIIAIDGPAGAGKSTVARALAERLGLAYIDSGASYRAAALKVVESGVSPANPAAVIEVVNRAEIAFAAWDGDWRVTLDKRDVTGLIRTPEVTQAAALVSRLPEVRRKLIALQRQAARGAGVVMEGRDIGTVVFPDAPLKIFLEADPAERARRRLDQEQAGGRQASLSATANEIRERDELDAARTVSPLVPAADAVRIDSTELSAEQVVEKVLDLARERRLIPEREARNAEC